MYDMDNARRLLPRWLIVIGRIDEARTEFDWALTKLGQLGPD